MKRSYDAPKVEVVGTVHGLTAQNNTGTKTDVPQNTPVPPFSIFS